MTRCLPNFLIIGAHKAGTTSIHRYLDQHPQVFMSPVKEPRFFALENDPLDYRGPNDPASRCAHKTLEAYSRLFDGAGTALARGEASTLYLYHKSAPANIHSYIPEAKLIVILRQPADRAYSNYVYARLLGLEPLDEFEVALDVEEDRIQKQWGPLWHYRRKGLYHEQIGRYRDVFDHDHLKVILFEDLVQHGDEILEELFEFIGVDPDFQIDTNRAHNRSGVPRSKLINRLFKRKNPVRTALIKTVPGFLREPFINTVNRRNIEKAPLLSAELRSELTASFEQDIIELQGVIGRDLAHWL